MQTLTTLKTKLLIFYKTHTQSLIVTGTIILFFIAILPVYGIYSVLKSDTSDSSSLFDGDSEYSDCNVQGISIKGDLYTYIPTDADGYALSGYEDAVASEYITTQLSEAEYNEDIQGILIEVDSYGGSPVAGEEVANDIGLSSKPVVVFVRSSAASASYWAISSADYIFASKNSDVGGIGITSSYLDNVAKNQQEGYSYVQLSSGKFKDLGVPDKNLSTEERDLIMRDINIVFENFVQAVSENRDLTIDAVKEIADGSTVLGAKAKELGLIDGIGGYNEALMYLEDQVGEGANVCW